MKFRSYTSTKLVLVWENVRCCNTLVPAAIENGWSKAWSTSADSPNLRKKLHYSNGKQTTYLMIPNSPQSSLFRALLIIARLSYAIYQRETRVTKIILVVDSPFQSGKLYISVSHENIHINQLTLDLQTLNEPPCCIHSRDKLAVR